KGRAWPLVSTAIRARVCSQTFRACTVLECFRNDPRGMACASTVYIGDAFRSMALFRAGVVFGGWVSFLVAGCSTLAGCLGGIAMVDPFIPFSCHVAVRHPLWISTVL